MTEMIVRAVIKQRKAFQSSLKKKRGQAKHICRPHGTQTAIWLHLDLFKRQILFYIICILSFMVNIHRNSASLISHFPHDYFLLGEGQETPM